MKVQDAGLHGLKRIELDVFTDERGYFLESHQAERYAQALGYDGLRFVQDNCSHSHRGVLRGLHYQIAHPQGKLLRVVQGAIFDVAVDLRMDSATFGKWDATVLAAPGFQAGDSPDTGAWMEAVAGARLDIGRHVQLWVPPGFAHGFWVLSDSATVEYKCTDYYYPEDEACLRWDDPDLAIAWPSGSPILSAKDRQGSSLADLLRSGKIPAATARQKAGSALEAAALGAGAAPRRRPA